jgi:hypothetical protein
MERRIADSTGPMFHLLSRAKFLPFTQLGYARKAKAAPGKFLAFFCAPIETPSGATAPNTLCHTPTPLNVPLIAECIGGLFSASNLAQVTGLPHVKLTGLLMHQKSVLSHESQALLDD